MKHAFYKRQQGFTLLELLVVITLLAVLAVGALVAYEGVGDNANATAAANNTATVDRAVRTYKAVEFHYPDQWDNLSVSDNANAFTSDIATDSGTQDGAHEHVMAYATSRIIGSWNLGGSTISGAVAEAFDEVGIEELQSVSNANRVTAAQAKDNAPNLLLNEGTNPNAGEQVLATTGGYISVIAAGTGCQAGGQPIADDFGTANPNLATAAAYLNKVNDSLETNTCHLVAALGFGNDAAASTAGTKAPIVTAATYTSRTVNPANTYSRYIGLFHLGSAATSGAADITEVNDKAVLIGFIDPEGKTLEENRAAANAN